MSLSPTVKIAIVSLCITLGVMVGVVVFFFHIKNVNSEVVSLERNAALIAEQQEEFYSIREMLQNNSDDIEKLNTYIISAEGVPAFLSQIESFRSISGTVIETKSINTRPHQGGDEESEKEPLTEILDLSVKITGSWRQVYHAISLIETIPVKLSVTALQLTQQTRNQSAAGSPLSNRSGWEASLKLEVLKRTSDE